MCAHGRGEWPTKLKYLLSVPLLLSERAFLERLQVSVRAAVDKTHGSHSHCSREDPGRNRIKQGTGVWLSGDGDLSDVWGEEKAGF